MRFQKLPRLPLALRWISAHFWPNEFWSLERPCSIQWIFGGRRSMAGTAREMLLADVAALLPELTITLCSVCCYYWALSRKKTTHELRREYSNVKIQYTLLRIEILNFEVLWFSFSGATFNLWKWLRLLKVLTILWLKSGTIWFAKFAKTLRGQENGSGIDVWTFTKSVKSAKRRTKSVLVVNRFLTNIARYSNNCWVLKAWSSIASIQKMDAKKPLLKIL